MGNVWPTQHKSEVKFESEPDDMWSCGEMHSILRTYEINEIAADCARAFKNSKNYKWRRIFA